MNNDRPGGVSPIAAHEVDLNWAKTLAHLRADFARARLLMNDEGTLLQRLFWCLLPQFQVLIWYRVSRCLYLKGWRNTARVINLVCVYLTCAELPPTSSIGPGCVIGHAAGTRIMGRVGVRFTIFADAGIGGGMGEGEVGGGPGLPNVGDDVTMAVKSMVLGPVTVGDGAKLGPGVIVTRHVPAGASVFTAPPRMILAQAIGEVPGNARRAPEATASADLRT